MKFNILLLTAIFLHFTALFYPISAEYEPKWESLDKRPSPQWYDDAKFGIFMHWGVYSVPAYGGAWLWNYWKSGQKNVVNFLKNNYRPDITYADFAHNFHASFYDPDRWARIFKAAGAKYVVLTSKHHEGWTNFPSKWNWNWNAKDVGPNKDLIGMYAKALRNVTGIHVGLYYSLFEFYNPLFLLDQKNNFTTYKFITNKMIPELKYIVEEYKPDVIWADGNWAATSNYFKTKEFLAWLFNKSPVRDTVAVNDRWGSETPCKHGGYFNCNDRYNPHKLQQHKWENAMTTDKGQWAYRRDLTLDDVCTVEYLLFSLVSTVSCGGNLLLNVGPTADGTIIPIFEERLRQIGQWLDINGEAIYKTRPWTVSQNDSLNSNVWYTTTPKALYAIVLKWPTDNTFILGSVAYNIQLKISMLGYKGEWGFHSGSQGLEIPNIISNPSKLPSNHAWVFRITGLDIDQVDYGKDISRKRFRKIEDKDDVLKFRPQH